MLLRSLGIAWGRDDEQSLAGGLVANLARLAIFHLVDWDLVHTQMRERGR